MHTYMHRYIYIYAYTAAYAFAAHVCAILSRFAMDMSLAGLVMGIGAALAPLRSPRACLVRAPRLPPHCP